MDLLAKINAVLDREFNSLDELLRYYQTELPLRVQDYHQEEVGPVIHHDLPGEADKFVKKIFHLGGHTLDMSGGIDWYATPTGDLEWNGALVRHGYLMLLAGAYEKTGEEKYAAAVVEHLLDYITRVPRFDPACRSYLEYKKSTWRPFEVAARVAETWPEALAKVIRSRAMTPENWARILLAVYDHADFLFQHHWRTGNHASLEAAALGLVGIFYREFKRAGRWRQYAVNFLMDIWPQLFYEDGYTKEMSGGYHWVAMRSYFTFYEVAVKNGLAELFPPVFIERLHLTAMAELKQHKPDFSPPVTNDSNSGINRREQLWRVTRLLNIAEISYCLTGGKKGKKPGFTSCFFPNARVGVMRSDWTVQTRYLFFDMGSWGDNHMNEDQLNVEVSAWGRKFLTNCGRWRYTTSPGIPWKTKAMYFKTTAAYNSVLVNGYGQMPGDATGGMKIYDDYDFAWGMFDAGYGEEEDGVDEKLLRERGLTGQKACRVKGVTHKRQIIFVKPDFWLLRDIITGAGVHRAEQVWHYYDGDLRQLPGGLFTATSFDEANLLVGSLGNNRVENMVFKGSEDPFRGWHCPDYDQRRPAPELSYSQRGEEKIIFHTLLFPVPGRVSCIPDFTVTEFGYSVTYQGKTRRVDAPEEGEWKLIE